MFVHSNKPRETYVERGNAHTRPLTYIRAYERELNTYANAQARHEKRLSEKKRRPQSARGPGSGKRKGKRKALKSARGSSFSESAERRRSTSDAPVVGEPGGGAAAAEAEEAEEAEPAPVWFSGELVKYHRSQSSLFGCGSPKAASAGRKSATRYFTVERRDRSVYARWAPSAKTAQSKWKETVITDVLDDISNGSELGFTLVTGGSEDNIEVLAADADTRKEWIQRVRFLCRSNNIQRKTSQLSRSSAGPEDAPAKSPAETGAGGVEVAA